MLRLLKSHRLLKSIATLSLALIAVEASRAETPSALKLWRLDCGNFSAPIASFSDLFAHPGERKTYVDSCYLIRHGDDLLLWDAGLPTALIGKPEDASSPIRMHMTISIADQLAQIGLKPADVTILGLSHNHSDHTGQGSAFPGAKLVMDKADFDALRQTPPPFFTAPETLQPWLVAQGHKQLISGDYDVFGDGTVVMIALPGHTPGNHGLLVHLAHGGPVLISGDAIHSPEQLTSHGLPPSNASRSDSLASIDRIVGIVRDAHAKLVIEHDAASVAILPAFPKFED